MLVLTYPAFGSHFEDRNDLDSCIPCLERLIFPNISSEGFIQIPGTRTLCVSMLKDESQQHHTPARSYVFHHLDGLLTTRMKINDQEHAAPKRCTQVKEAGLAATVLDYYPVCSNFPQTGECLC